MIDHSSSDKVLELIFNKLNKSNRSLAFPSEGSLSQIIINSLDKDVPSISHREIDKFATASIEMWQRAIHSFIWSVALSRYSKLWSSVSGYYASHYVMRAFSHAFGFFKSFKRRKVLQVTINSGNFIFNELGKTSHRGEHTFYWEVVKNYPDFTGNPLFRLNSERDDKSDSSHRNFANYIDHINNFEKIGLLSNEMINDEIEKISRIRRYSITEVYRDDYPDLHNVQVLAYQRIVTFRDFLDERIKDNRFWIAHRDPYWCRDLMIYQLEDADTIMTIERINS